MGGRLTYLIRKTTFQRQRRADSISIPPLHICDSRGKKAILTYLLLVDDERAACALDAHIRPMLV